MSDIRQFNKNIAEKGEKERDMNKSKRDERGRER